MFQSKKIHKLIAIIVLSATFISLPATILAQTQQPGIIGKIQDQAKEFNQKSGIGLPGENEDPKIVIGSVITYLLGFLGIVFLLLIIYAGVYWMTAMGDTNKVSKAKKIIGTASMGIAVIVLSLAIVQFVLLILGQAFK